MTNYVYVLLDDRSPNMDSLIRQLKPYCADDIETHSSAGVEIVSMILDIGQFALALIQLPYLYDMFSKKEIVVKFEGITMNDSVDDLLGILKNNPTLLERAKTALQNSRIEIEGKGKAVDSFLEQLRSLIDKEDAE